MSKPSNNKLNFDSIIKTLFFVGTFIVSFVTAVIIFVAAMNDNNTALPLFFSHPTITNVLIIIVFFMNIANYKDNKVYYWFILTALISSCITLILSAGKMSQDIELLMDRKDIANYFFRLHQIILPMLYLIFYIFLDKHSLSKKRSLLFIFVYPLIYVIAVQILSNLKGAKGVQVDLSFFASHESILFNVLKIGFLFLPLTPSVLGVTYLKQEVSNKPKLKTSFLAVGSFLIFLALSGFWYPFPFDPSTFKSFNNKVFAERTAKRYNVDIKLNGDSQKPSTYNNSSSSTPQRDSNSNNSVNNSNNSSSSLHSTTQRNPYAKPNKIFNNSYLNREVDSQEYNYIYNNWDLLYANNFKYNYDQKQYVLNYDERNLKFYRERISWYNPRSTNIK
ncbi:hypothetical protein [Candidatus Phytoplasma meliae]|uniref:Uncharacterized protein n=1 Tax=Candidatus Phytoplasma meliae TaxID=1848402 RepID=A0ABS5CYJ6_9MOLU|nr:hypothetical protein [Candidatus Phytoplasma meliae]MBP5836049.1 hypothetical protein [Candidatus Phytoplasma meliae]